MNGVKKRVAVIGAGLSGLSILRHFSENNDFQLTCFEKNFQLGGVWAYTDQTVKDDFGEPITTGMYSYLKVNIPKQLMEIEGFPLPADTPTFPQQPQMLKYLNEIADSLGLQKYIKFNTGVKSVVPIDPGKRETKWKVTYYDVRKEGSDVTEIFDVVIVCSGNCTQPKMPKIEGESDFGGFLIHSMRYRHPEVYSGQTVALLGAHFSGLDIAVQLSKYAKKIYLCHRLPNLDTVLPDNVIQKSSGFKKIKRSSVVLENGEELDVDAIIYCTGYLYDYPFLPKGIINIENNIITNLFQEIVPINYNTLMFMATPREVAFFRHCDHQALFIRGIVDGTIKLPSQEQMKATVALDLKERPVGGDTQWKWEKDIAAITGSTKTSPAVLKKIWDHHFDIWGKNFVKCRQLDYKVTGHDTFISM